MLFTPLTGEMTQGRAENFSERFDLRTEEDGRPRRRSKRKRARIEISSTSGLRSREELWWGTWRINPE